MIEPPERITSRSARAAFAPALEKYSTPDGALFLEGDSRDVCIGDDREIFAMERGFEVCVGGAVPAAVLLRHLVQACAILKVAIEIRIGWDAEGGRRFEESMCEGIHAAQVAYVEGAVRAVKFRFASRLHLRFLEVGEDVIETPALISEAGPMIEVEVISADVNHGVHRARAAQHFSARPVEAAVVEAGLGLGGIVPVDGCLVEFGEGCGDADFLCFVGAACFEEQNARVGILG